MGVLLNNAGTLTLKDETRTRIIKSNQALAPDGNQRSCPDNTRKQERRRVNKMKAFDLIELEETIEVMDIGAAMVTTEVPIYRTLLEMKLAKLHAFEGDSRQIEKLISTYGDRVSIYNDFIFDGSEQTLHLANEETGMTSLLKPDIKALRFFNGFEEFGKIEKTERVETKKLDDIAGLPSIDFVKMDVQGSELTVLKNGTDKLKDTLAMQLEVSYICLYENQPSFGEVDVWMRAQGYAPHSLLEVKRWSIAPTIFEGNFRVGGNQLLEADITYVKNPLQLADLNNLQLKKFATLAHYCFNSHDLCVHILLELVRRGELDSSVQYKYYDFLAQEH
jgi:FkbM family methyltransferase